MSQKGFAPASGTVKLDRTALAALNRKVSPDSDLHFLRYTLQDGSERYQVAYKPTGAAPINISIELAAVLGVPCDANGIQVEDSYALLYAVIEAMCNGANLVQLIRQSDGSWNRL